MTIPFWQRLLGIIFYLLPWSDSLPFGRYLFVEIPLLQLIAIPALPIIFIQSFIPLGSLILFLVIFILIIRNPKVPYFLRFNSLQAILINIGIIIINYIFEIFLQPFGNILLVRTFSSTILLLILAMIFFSILECVQGKEADLPLITNAVKIQL